MATIQFNEETNLTGIVQGVDFEVDTDRNTYGIEDLTRNANFALDYLSLELSEFNGTIQHTEPATEQFNVTSGTTNSITSTSDFVKVLDVVVEDDNGDFISLKPIDPDLTEQPFDEVISQEAGTPTGYAQRGNLITFDKKFDFTKTNAVTLRYEPLPTYFVDTDTTATANYIRNLSEAIVLYTALKWAKKYQTGRVNDLEGDLANIIDKYKKMLSSSNKDLKRGLKANVENTR